MTHPTDSQAELPLPDGDEFAENEKHWLENLRKLRVFDYFGRFDQVTAFLRLVIVVFMLATTLMIGLVSWFYLELSKKSEILEKSTVAMTMLIQQQELQTSWTFGTRLASDYYSLSYVNARTNADRILEYLHPHASFDVKKELLNLVSVIEKGRLIQSVESIDYDSIVVSEVDKFQGERQFFIQIPLTVRLQKDGVKNMSRMQVTFGVYATMSEKTLLNPFGLRIVNLGKIQ